MSKVKLLQAVLLLVLGCTFCANQGVLARCSKSVLRNVCNLCEEKALSNLNADSVCPSCPEVNCPQASLACIRPNSFENFLSSNYTLTGIVTEGSETLLKLNIRKSKELPGVFNYDVRLANFRPVVKDSVGFLIYDIINFNLPVVQEAAILSYNCIGVIDNTSVFKGVCSTIAPDDKGSPQLFGFEYTATPNDSPLK